MIRDIKLLDFPEQPTLIMRATIPVEKMPEFFGKAFGGVMNYLSELGLMPAGMPFGTYFNMNMSAMEVEAGFPVRTKIDGKNEIISGVIPAGTFISTIFEGSYNDLKIAYDALAEYAQQNGLEPTGISYEYYLNDPSGDPSIIPLTEIRFPIK
jgi:effector-binding domain-containing protein